MPSTSSSAEATASKRSATETLAARYRHLFVLPRTVILLLLMMFVSLLLNLVTRGNAWAVPFAISAAVVILSALVISNTLRLADRTTIATFRRTSAVLLTNQLLWLLCAAVGLGYTMVIGTDRPLANAVLFGAFVCSGLEFLVVNGAFTENIPLSASLAAIHPLGTLLIIGLPSHIDSLTYIVVSLGAIAYAIIAIFTLLLRRRKTSRGYNAVRLFQAFMKTWTCREVADLEAIISDHAEPAEVTTKVMRFHREDGDIFVVLPGVHPGPFFPVGSYNLPGVISNEFKELGPVLTLHRPGGHERNLATNAQTREYASKISGFARNVNPIQTGTIRGPLYVHIGKAAVSSSSFSNDVLLTISFAPLGSDDLEPQVEDELSRLASTAGYNASVVDAHNSIDHGQEQPDTADPRWEQLFDIIDRTEERPLKVAYSHSGEVKFSAGEDITENGVGLLMLETGGIKSVLVLADANNAVPTLHEETTHALESAGFRLVEICTSDSHDLAARGLTVTRGYKALGEDTPTNRISKLVVSLAGIAENRLAPCRYGSGQLTSSVRVFGPKALNEFASITQSSSGFAKRYSGFAAVSIVTLLALSLTL